MKKASLPLFNRQGNRLGEGQRHKASKQQRLSLNPNLQKVPYAIGLNLLFSFPSPTGHRPGIPASFLFTRDSVNPREEFCAFAKQDCKGHQGLYSVSLDLV